MNHEFSDPSEFQGMRADDPRRAAEHCRDLSDSALIGAAMDEPVSASKLPVRTFGQLPDLQVPEDFDEPLTDAENAVWEADSAD